MVIGAVHILAIFWLASQSARKVRQGERVTDLIHIASSPGSTTVVAVAPLEPLKVVVPSLSPIVVARQPAAAASTTPAVNSAGLARGTAVGAGGCALDQTVGDAILANAAAMAELEALPRQARTEADAVMVWDGAWPEPAPPAVTPLLDFSRPGALRRAVEIAITSAPAECRDAPVAGPRFIALPGVFRTTTIVIGSGQWRWADVLKPDVTCGVATTSKPALSGSCVAIDRPSSTPPGTN
jgi:hypothetical protein